MSDGYEAMRESINYQADTLDPTLMNLMVARQAVYRLRTRLAEAERELAEARRELAEPRNRPAYFLAYFDAGRLTRYEITVMYGC